MSPLLFASDLPRPGPDRLIIYFLGPGGGESQVVVLPDGRCIVVDTCMQGDENLPGALLKHLGLHTIDLLVLSHPDLDHLRGFASLVTGFSPRRIWRYPFAGYLRELVSFWCRRDASNKRFQELHQALSTIEAHSEAQGTTIEASFSTRHWPPESGADYEVHCLAPTSYDQARVRDLWQRIIEVSPSGEPRLSGFLKRFLRGDAHLSLPANVLSLALALKWKGRKLLLGGDVENGNRSPHSGWKGVISHAQRDGLDSLLRELDLVKVAHHGSSRSFHPPRLDPPPAAGRLDGGGPVTLHPSRSPHPRGASRPDSVLPPAGHHPMYPRHPNKS